MAYLLYKDGLPRKYINIILILSLLIILSFPISMERLVLSLLDNICTLSSIYFLVHIKW